jgi:uncharacterized protein YcbK (DUF882 family)
LLLLTLIGSTTARADAPSSAVDAAGAAAATGGDAEPRTPSKKEQLLDEKKAHHVHSRHPLMQAARVVLTVRNAWTHEVLPVDPAQPPPARTVDELLRDHYTNQSTAMDPRLSRVILQAAVKFKSSLVEIVSGYRAPKYNLMLRKKGHAVARESQHPLGHAVDFRLAGVGTKALYKFVRSLHVGGVGYYPHNGFVHADVGPVRTWKGD